MAKRISAVPIAAQCRDDVNGVLGWAQRDVHSPLLSSPFPSLSSFPPIPGFSAGKGIG